MHPSRLRRECRSRFAACAAVVLKVYSARMGAHVEHRFTRGFLLDEERLRKLVHIVLERLPTDQSPAERLEFKVFRGDAYSYTTSSVEDVLKEDNADWRKITRLDLRSASEKPVMFSLRFDKAGTSLEIDGDDRDVVFVLFSDVREYLREEVNRAVSIPRNATRLLFMLVTILAMVWLLWWMYSRLGTFTDTAAAIATYAALSGRGSKTTSR